ncbi:MAG: hypothetical protein FJZ00_06735 [Candidatus Sericytochromatia bacterium]|uniref:MalT-like TPR region domain-containing protein n=1 Tax=Candidatus Tanganyikabacteria bacterium TaxID=2961651 RepID=A0A937X608_9BACT|nr:hypothetical protein [Candidatus Tanganyikabacteria bacterium]
MFTASYGLFRLHLLRAEYGRARGLGDELLALAERQGDPTLLAEGLRALGSSAFYMGRFAEARAFLERLSSIDATADRRAEAMRHDVVDCWVAARSHLSWVLWLQGEELPAVAASDEAIAMAREMEHGFSLALALSFASWLHQFRDDRARTRAAADEALTLSTDHGFDFWIGWARIMRAWAGAERARADEAAEEILQGLSAWRASGSQLGKTYFCFLLADAQARAGDRTTAIATLNDALAFADRAEERWWQPELCRLRGELERQGGDQAVPERFLQEALSWAQRLGSPPLVARATASLPD